MTRLTKYIGRAEDIVFDIKKYCGPWIKESKGLPGYRAARQIQTKGWVSKKPVRTNRKSLTMKNTDHRFLDKLFKKYYGWAARSNVLFTQGSPTTHYFYGPFKYAVFPIGSFKYLWTENFGDLAPVIDGLRYDIDHNFELPEDELESRARARIEEIVKESYKSTGLHTALTKYKTHEIMVNCKEYFIIPEEIYDLHISKLI